MCHRWRTSPGSHSPLHWLLSDRNASEMFVPNPGAGVNRWLAPSHAPGGADQMADLSFKILGIGLASSLLAGAISVAAATGVGAAPPGPTTLQARMSIPRATRRRLAAATQCWRSGSQAAA